MLVSTTSASIFDSRAVCWSCRGLWRSKFCNALVGAPATLAQKESDELALAASEMFGSRPFESRGFQILIWLARPLALSPPLYSGSLLVHLPVLCGFCFGSHVASFCVTGFVASASRCILRYSTLFQQMRGVVLSCASSKHYPVVQQQWSNTRPTVCLFEQK